MKKKTSETVASSHAIWKISSVSFEWCTSSKRALDSLWSVFWGKICLGAKDLASCLVHALDGKNSCHGNQDEDLGNHVVCSWSLMTRLLSLCQAMCGREKERNKNITAVWDVTWALQVVLRGFPRHPLALVSDAEHAPSSGSVCTQPSLSSWLLLLVVCQVP